MALPLALGGILPLGILPLGDPLDPDLLQEDEEGEEEDGLKLEELGPVEENFDPDEK